jgi:penicillin-binding protein-related factor A (putative recombinase)
MSKEWTEDQCKSLHQTQAQELIRFLVERASVLSTVYSKLIEIWRDKAATNESAQIALIRTSAHECELNFPRFLLALSPCAL